jgi:murein DD-endopeptidase MepM/ murein hydrolase activator NlpD
LGGNSVANQAVVLSILTKENAAIAAVYSRMDKALWTSGFAFPVASTTGSPLTVTDPYGYNRDSGANTITHKGVDFHAPPGTPVYAVNRGVVRVAKSYTVYGNTVIVDHGLGLLSMYMHLSKMSVYPGQLVTKGQRLGLSGETGYAEGPHLHLTVRIGGVSVDPMGFFALFGAK